MSWEMGLFSSLVATSILALVLCLRGCVCVCMYETVSVSVYLCVRCFREFCREARTDKYVYLQLGDFGDEVKGTAVSLEGDIVPGGDLLAILLLSWNICMYVCMCMRMRFGDDRVYNSSGSA